jgi:hypothetical protein
LFVPSDLSFNENIATFIGDYGSLAFLKSYYGDTSTTYKDFKKQIEDYRTYSDYIVESAKRLDAFYGEIRDLPEKKRAKIKERKLKSIVKGIWQLEFHNPFGFQNKFLVDGKGLPDNNYFMSYLRYRGRQDEIEKEFHGKFKSDTKTYIRHLQEKYRSL